MNGIVRKGSAVYDLPIPHPIIARLDRIASDSVREMMHQQEEYLQHARLALGLTIDEFVREYILEEYPMEFENVVDPTLDDLRYRVKQTIRLRRKTAEEKAADAVS